jgi:hypothetical protein
VEIANDLFNVMSLSNDLFNVGYMIFILHLDSFHSNIECLSLNVWFIKIPTSYIHRLCMYINHIKKCEKWNIYEILI